MKFCKPYFPVIQHIQCFPDAVSWLNSWPIQKKLGIKGFFSETDETEASLYRCAETKYSIVRKLAHLSIII